MLRPTRRAIGIALLMITALVLAACSATGGKNAAQAAIAATIAGVQKGLGSAATMTKVYVQGTDNAAMLSSMTAKLTQDKSIDAVIVDASNVNQVATYAAEGNR